jgi:hypothetical protein
VVGLWSSTNGLTGLTADSDIAEVWGGVVDRGCLGGFDRTPNAGKFPWGDQVAVEDVDVVSRSKNRPLPMGNIDKILDGVKHGLFQSHHHQLRCQSDNHQSEFDNGLGSL